MTFSTGKTGILEPEGIRPEAGDGVVPYVDMTLEQLEEVVRENERHLQIPEDRPATKEQIREITAEHRKMARAWELDQAVKRAEEKAKLKAMEKVAEVVLDDEVPPPIDEEIPF